MKQTTIILLAAGLLILAMLTSTTVNASEIYDVTDWLIPQFEGFRPNPYWDVSRYSWGYGTPAPGPTGTITPDQALTDMREVVQVNYNTLHPLITRQLSNNQWGALMSFAYEEGTGNAQTGAIALVPDINASSDGNDSKLEAHFKEYIYAGGVIDNDIVARRNAEWQLWLT
jgi:GH24 family phage-related lysozyme (muramidase)